MWKLLCGILLLAGVFHQVSLQERDEGDIHILGFFEKDKPPERAFTQSILSRIRSPDIPVSPKVLYPTRDDSFSVWNDLCSETKATPIAVIGPQNPLIFNAVKHQCSLMHIPHIQATLTQMEQDTTFGMDEINEDIEMDELYNEPISLNFFPPADDISIAYAQLIRDYKWENFAVLYEDDAGLMRIQKILAHYSGSFPITVRRLEYGGDNKQVFKTLDKFKDSRVLLDCDVDHVIGYLNEATEMNMLNEYQHYILTTLDAGILNDVLKEKSSNITWLSVTNIDIVSDPQHDLTTIVGQWVSGPGKIVDSPQVTKIKLETLLMDDIANHIKQSLKLLLEKENEIIRPPVICSDPPQPWEQGQKFMSYLLKTDTNGVSGKIVFDSNGKRKDYNLYANEIYLNERHTIARWESATKEMIRITRTQNDTNIQTKKSFVIIGKLGKPYLSYTDSNKTEYEGFSKDLADEIFLQLRKMGYNYSHTFAPNLEGREYGSYDPVTKKWNGLIGDLLSKTADLAIGDITITEERKKAVDFSVPVMSLGIGILYKKEHHIPPDTFSFLHPYSFEVWMYTATAYCVVSIVLFICSRISPADWENPQPCDKDPEELENIWNFKNCAWMTMGSIMTQGCDILPKAVGTRWVCGLWWFFAMIVCQTYIAQLSASLTSLAEEEPINSVDDLATQNKIIYGMIKNASTYNFFKNSKDKMYQRMFETMEANPVVYVKTNDEGVQFVLNTKKGYAFFMESSTIEYKLRRNCDLKQVGGPLDAKDYGIAMPPNSPFRSQINSAILKLKEDSQIDKIEKRWWNEKYEAKDCNDEAEKGDVEGDLEMENLIGAFLVLIYGLVFCLLISIGEFLFECHNIVIREQISHKVAIKQELRAVLDFRKNQKPVLRNPSRAPSLVGSLKDDDRFAIKAANIGDFINFEKH